MKIYLTFICRDNQDTIKEMIQSCLPIVDGIIVCDTGSKDNTLEVIKETVAEFSFLKEIDSSHKDIPLHIYQDEWINFGHNRSLMMEHCRKHPEADYVFVMDTDEVLVIESGFTKKDIRLESDCIMINTPDEHYTYPRDRIFNNHIIWKWKGAAHEYPYSKEMQSKSLAKHLTLKLRPKPPGYTKHIERNLKLLTEDYEKNPDDARTLFYIGLSYRDLGKHDKAREFLLKRYNMENTWDEERWYSIYVVAIMSDASGNIERAEKEYLEAYEFRPKRAEPLFRLSKMLYAHQKRNKAIMYMKMAYEMPAPAGESVFLEERIYRWECKFELSHMLFYDADTQETGYNCCLELLQEKEKLGIPKNVLDRIYENTRLYDINFIAIGKPKRFIIQLPNGYDGLGDHLYYSHLPELYKSHYPDVPVYISHFNTYKTPLTKQVVWFNNPYVEKDTEIDAYGTYRDMNALNLVMRNNNQIMGMNMMEQIAVFYGLKPLNFLPQIHIGKIPEKKDKERIDKLQGIISNKVVFDGNYKHYAGVTKKQVVEYFKRKNIKVDYQIGPFDSTNYIQLPGIEMITFESIYDYIFCMGKASVFYGLMTGSNSLAVAMGYIIKVFVGEFNLKNYMFPDLLEYIKLSGNEDQEDKVS